MEHKLTVSRYWRGKAGWGDLRGAAGRMAGTAGRCSCGDWSTRHNIAPSAGGRKWTTDEWKAHVALATAVPPVAG